MRTLKDNLSLGNLYEVKALFDIALLNKATTYNPNSYSCSNNHNIFSFIYGPLDSASANDSENNLNSLNYRKRPIATIEEVLISHSQDDWDFIDVIHADILNAFDAFLNGSSMIYYPSNKSINKIEVTRKSIEKALDTLCDDVLKLSMRLYHNETLYTLMLDTPSGKAGFESLIKHLNSKNDSIFTSTAIESNFGAVKYMFLVKNTSLGDTEKQFIDMQGLFGNALKNYKTFVNEHPDIIKSFRTMPAIDMKTENGFIDRSTLENDDSNKDNTIDDYSLTNLFDKCYSIDKSLFTPRNANYPRYSIFEWYVQFKSISKLERCKNSIGINMPKFRKYLDTFESNLVLGREDVMCDGENPNSDFSTKIDITSNLFNFLYKEWYMQNDAVISRDKINRLCELCQNSYFHLVFNSSSNLRPHSIKNKIVNGLLDVNRNQVGPNDLYLSHYLNLSYYNSLPAEERDSYIMLTSKELEIVNVYNDNFINERVNELASSTMKSNGNNKLDFILLPAGLERIELIMSIFSELDVLSKKLEKCGASLQELLPAYYNREPCSLYGALNFIMQSKRLYESNPENYFLSYHTMKSIQDNHKLSSKFDWSIPKWNFDVRQTKIDNSSTKHNSSILGFQGLGNIHYPKYIEAGLFTIFSLAFPCTLKHDKATKNYVFHDTLFAKSIANENYALLKDILESTPEEKSNKVREVSLEDMLSLANSMFMRLKASSDKIENTEINYEYDIRREFFSESNVDSLYSIFTMICLLYTEFYSYYAKNKYFETKSSNFNRFSINPNNNANNKVSWTTEVKRDVSVKKGDTVEKVEVVECHRNFKDVIKSKYVIDMPGRVEDIMSRIPTALNNAMITSQEHEYSMFSNILGLSPGWSCKSLLESYANLLINNKCSLSIPALMEENMQTIQNRINKTQSIAKTLCISANKNKRRLNLAFADMDTILIDGCRYKLYINKDKGILIAEYLKKESNSITNFYSATGYFIDSDGRPVGFVDNKIPYGLDLESNANNWESLDNSTTVARYYDNCERITFSQLLKMLDLSDKDKYKDFIRNTSNGRSINFMAARWEPLVNRMVKFIHLVNVFNNTNTKIRNVDKGSVITNLKNFLVANGLNNEYPILVMNTSRVWQLIEYMFCGDLHGGSENILATFVRNSNSPLLIHAYHPDSVSYETGLYTLPTSNSKKQYYPSVNIGSTKCSMISPYEAITLKESTWYTKDLCGNTVEKRSYNYYWRLNDLGYPMILDYLANWRSSKIILEEFSSIHNIAYAYNTINKLGAGVESSYKNMMISCIVNAFSNDVKTTAIQELDSNVELCMQTVVNSNACDKYGFIKWHTYGNISNNDTWDLLRNRLDSLQFSNIKNFIKPEIYLPNQKDTFCLFRNIPTGIKGPMSSVMNDYVKAINDIRSIKLYDVNGYGILSNLDTTALNYYNIHLQDILNVVEDDSTYDIINYISTYGIGRSLEDEPFYRRGQYSVSTDGTGVLFDLYGNPIMIKKCGNYCFLHESSNWIVFENPNHIYNIKIVPYGEI